MHFSIQGQKQTASLYNRCVMNLKNLNKQQQIKYIAIIGACLLIALLYLGGIAFYSSHFLPKTKIFDLDVSNQNVATVNEKLKEITPTISLVELDKNANTIEESIDMRKMNEDIDYDASGLLKKQDKLAWFISMFQQKDLEPDQIQGSFTKAEVKQIIQNCYFLNEDNIVMPQDATLAIENNKVVLKDAIDGNFIEEQEVIDLISQRMKNFQSATGETTLDLTQDYEKPQLYQDDPSFEGKIETYQKVLDKEVTIKAEDLEPYVTWGTNPGQGAPISATVPDPESIADETERNAARRAIDYMGLKPGMAIKDIAVDTVFIGSCTNGRLEDLRVAASIMKGHHKAENIHRVLVVPASSRVRLQAEKEGLDKIFKDFGAEWRNAGCSMCLGMNPDKMVARERSISTSNRNFEGRQGKGSRTHLASPAVAAATAIRGTISSPADL